MKLKDFVVNVEQWAEDRNLIKGGNADNQLLKSFSEFGELSDAIIKGDVPGIRDGIGDVFVTVVILCKQITDYSIDVNFDFDMITLDKIERDGINKHEIMVDIASALSDINYTKDFTEIVFGLVGLSIILRVNIEDCCEVAYNEIKDRKGVMYNGAFIKEADAIYPEILERIRNEKNI